MKNILIGVAVIGLLLYWSNANAAKTAPALLPDEEDEWQPPTNAYTGKAVQRQGSTTLYRVDGVLRIKYTSKQAWINDGSREVVVLSPEAFDAMPEVTNAEINENGKIQK